MVHVSETPNLEALEARIVPSTDAFSNPAGGDWWAAANWSLGHSPLTGDDVIIPALAGNALVSYGDMFQSSVTINSLTLEGTLELSPGVRGFNLGITGSVTGSGMIVLAGGTLRGATVAKGVTIKTAPLAARSNLDGLTLHGQLVVTDGAQVIVTNGLRLSGTIKASGSDTLLALENLSIDTTGHLVLLDGAQAITHGVSSHLENAGRVTIGEGSSLTIGTAGLVGGSYTQTSTGTLEVPIGSTPAGHPSPRLFAQGGSVSLAGTLKALYTNGYSPSPGQSFWVISGVTRRTGSFNTVEGGTTVYQGDNILLNASASPAKAARLVVTVPPPDIVSLGSTFQVQVSAEDSHGTVDPSFMGDVTIQLANNPSNATLFGTLTVTAVRGMATFSDLILTKSGAYTLQMTGGGLTVATTAPFQVAFARVQLAGFIASTNIPQPQGGNDPHGEGQTVALLQRANDLRLVNRADPGFGSGSLARLDHTFEQLTPPRLSKLDKNSAITPLPGTNLESGRPEDEGEDVERKPPVTPNRGVILTDSPDSSDPTPE
jgi:hypothetical protein